MEFDNNFATAENLYEQKRYREALNLFMKLNQRNSSNDCMNYIGCCYLKLKEYAQAIEIFQRLIKDNPDWERPLFNLGRVYLAIGSNDQALYFFKQAVTMNPNSSDGFYYLGLFYSEMEDYTTAKLQYIKSLSIDYDQPETHLNLGVCNFNLQLYQEALNEFNITLHLDSSCIDALNNKGLTCFMLGNYNDALTIYLTLHKQFPRDIGFIMEIVRCYYRLCDFDNSLKWNQEILKLQPNNKKALLLINKIQSKKENQDQRPPFGAL